MLIDSSRRNKTDRRQASADAVFGASADLRSSAVMMPSHSHTWEPRVPWTCPHAPYYPLLVCIAGLLDPLSTGLHGEFSLPRITSCHSTHRAHSKKHLKGTQPLTNSSVACDGGRPQDNYCALLRTLLLSSLLGMDTNPNSRSLPSASSS